MRKNDVIANAPTAGDKARALSKDESARFFGPQPLIAGEDQAQYEAMRDQVSGAVGPLDFLDEIWVNDIANLVWEELRWRRLKAALLQAAARYCIYEWFTRLPDWLASNWASREPEVVAKVVTLPLWLNPA